MPLGYVISCVEEEKKIWFAGKKKKNLLHLLTCAPQEQALQWSGQTGG